MEGKKWWKFFGKLQLAKLQRGNCQLAVATWQLPIANWQLPISNCQLAIAKLQLGKLQLGKLQLAKLQPAKLQPRKIQPVVEKITKNIENGLKWAQIGAPELGIMPIGSKK